MKVCFDNIFVLKGYISNKHKVNYHFITMKNPYCCNSQTLVPRTHVILVTSVQEMGLVGVRAKTHAKILTRVKMVVYVKK